LVRGLYTSASGALVAESMADTVASNLANTNTSGFKQMLLQIQSTPSLDIYRIQTDPGKTVNGVQKGQPVSQEVGLLGTGVQVYDTPTDFEQGSLQSTGNPLDVAISNNANAFFTIQTPNGVRYTRDGEFSQDGQGFLRTRDGNPVLNTQGQPIQLAPTGGTVTIQSDGTIYQNSASATAGNQATAVGQLALTQFNSLLNLRPEGANNYNPSGNAGPTPATGVTVQQGYVEASGSNVVKSMVDLITAERWFDANEKSVKTQDDATNTAIAMVGKTQ
jgi:flagellar basal-body rod protein FlgF